jgi:hypothetical protein
MSTLFGSGSSLFDGAGAIAVFRRTLVRFVDGVATFEIFVGGSDSSLEKSDAEDVDSEAALNRRATGCAVIFSLRLSSNVETVEAFVDSFAGALTKGDGSGGNGGSAVGVLASNSE